MHWCFKPSLQILPAMREKLVTGDFANKIDPIFSQFTLKEIVVASLNFSDKMASTFCFETKNQVNNCKRPLLHSRGHQVGEEVQSLSCWTTTLTTASCSKPPLMLVRSISSSVGTKAKPILRSGFHWKQEPPRPIHPKKPALPLHKRSPSLVKIFVSEKGKKINLYWLTPPCEKWVAAG